MLRLRLTSEILKVLGDLQTKQFRQVTLKILSLTQEPRPNDSAQLHGYPFLRVDVGEYRVVYDIDGEDLRIVIVGKRNDDEVYRRLERNG